MFDAFGVTVKHGAVRHAQSQGAAERFHRSLLTMIRKLHEGSSDWKRDLAVLLFYYRVRPHSVLKMSPAKAMMGWEPRDMLIESKKKEVTEPQWTEDLQRRIADIRDYVQEQLAAVDFIEAEAENPYQPGDPIQLRNSDRRQKRMPAYDRGWIVVKVVSPSRAARRP